jgi:hypothetical protein
MVHLRARGHTLGSKAPHNNSILSPSAYKFLPYILVNRLVVVHVDGVRLCLCTAVPNEPIVYPPGNEYGEPRWKTEELEEKSVPVPLCPPQISHRLTRARI